MIETLDSDLHGYRVSAVYGVMGRDQAIYLDKLLAHLTLLVHADGGLANGDAALSDELRRRYGRHEGLEFYTRVTEECIALLRALAAPRIADSIHPLPAPSIWKLDGPVEEDEAVDPDSSTPPQASPGRRWW